MRIVVIYKWARNPDDARVRSDGTVDWRDAKLSVADDDHAAAAIARGLARAGDEIVGLTVGDGDASWALARGAERAVVVTDAAPTSATAAILAAAVRRIGAVDVVLLADSAWDLGVGASVGGWLGWPTLADVSSARIEGGRLLVTRRLDAGGQVVEARAPVVLAVTARTTEEHPPGMKEILAARRRPLEPWALADLDVPATPDVASAGTRLPDAGSAHVIDGADPAAAAAELVGALRSEGVL